jgi:antitoxin MazE
MYSNYVATFPSAVKTPKTVELKLVPIGNSRGVRLPKEIIERYALEETIVLEVHEEALVFRNKHDKRLSWEATFKAMAREREDWRDFDAAIADGLDPSERW